jgi:hypothetical protein
MTGRASKALAEAPIPGEPSNIRCQIKTQSSPFDYPAGLYGLLQCEGHLMLEQ